MYTDWTGALRSNRLTIHRIRRVNATTWIRCIHSAAPSQMRTVGWKLNMQARTLFNMLLRRTPKEIVLPKAS